MFKSYVMLQVNQLIYSLEQCNDSQFVDDCISNIVNATEFSPEDIWTEEDSECQTIEKEQKTIDILLFLWYNTNMKLESKCPCKGCGKRHPACHDSCSEYIEFKTDYTHKRELEAMQKYDTAAYISRVIKRSDKYGNNNSNKER